MHGVHNFLTAKIQHFQTDILSLDFRIPRQNSDAARRTTVFIECVVQYFVNQRSLARSSVTQKYDFALSGGIFFAGIELFNDLSGLVK